MSRVEKELEQIRKWNKGLLRPEDVVRFARNKRTALHSQFEWNNAKAGREYRLWQARELIIHVRIIPHPDASEPIRAYVSLKDDRTKKGGGYRASVEVLGHKVSRAVLLKEALEELRHFKQKYRELMELAPVFEAMEKIQSKPARKRRRA